MNSNILGIVMCGGMSTRMGTDKGLLKHKGKYWAEIVADKFLMINMPYVFSINAKQEEKYKLALGEDKNFEIDIKNSQFQGPLKGLMSVHKNYLDKDLIPIACDMIFFNQKKLERLLVANSKSSMESNFSFIFNNSDYCEPFGAIYKAKYLSKIEKEDKLLEGLSLQKLLHQGATSFISTGDKKSFSNFNKPEDLL